MKLMYLMEDKHSVLRSYIKNSKEKLMENLFLKYKFYH